MGLLIDLVARGFRTHVPSEGPDERRLRVATMTAARSPIAFIRLLFARMWLWISSGK